MDIQVESWDGHCWECGSHDVVIMPDPQMDMMTDMIICLDCHELQPETHPDYCVCHDTESQLTGKQNA